MNETARSLGGRLPLTDPAALAPAQRELYDQLISSWVVFTDKLGIQSTTQDGRLIGPFNALLLHPEVTAKLLEFQAAESANTGLTPTVREVVIIVLGSVYGADYELYAHEIVGRAVGLADDQVAALVGGDIPEDLGEHEKLAARLTRAMATRHHIDEELYRAAESAFGAKGLFDIAAVMGVYHTVCTMLTLFEVPAP
ncbi:4-carboxymuconolactone decarboxylase [Catenulispora sp. MAP5-51]|uniref:carboxymuconolactone decarboxylase family protein n=1 Tax=Catenulispora sp. MAP5-51 TaxID=3156298 RepID=UPI003511DC53